ncbi:MAG: glycosyltransferase [Acidobacteria bacterium]|nr:glycosyltransferase [Acidobacteriota bacterium]
MSDASISVVTPTFRRPAEIIALLENLNRQSVPPCELIIVDGAPESETETEQAVRAAIASLPFPCRYIRHGGGTAIQRNVGIEQAKGTFFALIDDDIRLEPDFFEQVLRVFREDREHAVGGVAAYITNHFLDPAKSPRWRWYRRLHLFSTFEPGRYDYATGYPINRYLQPPHDGLRPIDFMGTNCAVWRREVFDDLRFDPFFSGYGVLEDAHFALRAGRKWKLLECGLARCIHLRAPGGRANSKEVAHKTALNYRFVFMDLVPHRTWKQELRFWTVQFFDLFRVLAYAMRKRGRDEWLTVIGKATGIAAAFRLSPRQ